jgi:hypothetical protein
MESSWLISTRAQDGDSNLKLAMPTLSQDGGRPTPEIEFLDITLTKGSSLLIYDIYSPFYWWILKKTILLSVFTKNPQK